MRRGGRVIESEEGGNPVEIHMELSSDLVSGCDTDLFCVCDDTHFFIHFISRSMT